MTPERERRIQEVMAQRQPDLAVVLDQVDDPHNIGAILRSCDAFGVGHVHLLHAKGKAPRTAELKTKAAASALKWLYVTKWDSSAKLIRQLKKEKKMIVVTSLKGRSKKPSAIDFTKPVAIVLGNEHSGVSREMIRAAEVNARLPMIGFVKSFNVSVAAALLLYETYRQRKL
jgi:tRNA (guanosine-2'-O-)-methyltransferase